MQRHLGPQGIFKVILANFLFSADLHSSNLVSKHIPGTHHTLGMMPGRAAADTDKLLFTGPVACGGFPLGIAHSVRRACPCPWASQKEPCPAGTFEVQSQNQAFLYQAFLPSSRALWRAWGLHVPVSLLGALSANFSPAAHGCDPHPCSSCEVLHMHHLKKVGGVAAIMIGNISTLEEE